MFVVILVFVFFKISFLNFKFVFFLKKIIIVVIIYCKIVGWCFMWEIWVIELIYCIVGCYNVMFKGRLCEMVFLGGDFYYFFDIFCVFFWSIWR